jgi:protein-S-isoprenylcysteine O-methyltransferase Ste14
MSSDEKKVFVPPPVYFLVSFLVGWLLHALTDDRIGWRETTVWIGVLFVVEGLALAFWAERTFKRAGTTVMPYRRASALVTSGPFAFSRNPIYLGMAVLCVGGALVLGSWWPMVTLVIAMVLITQLVIKPEERLLAEGFGSEFEEYRSRVRRWL